MIPPRSFWLHRVLSRWPYWVAAVVICGVAGFTWGWRQPKPATELRWQADRSGTPRGRDMIMTADAPGLFETLADELKTSGFLEAAVRDLSAGWLREIEPLAIQYNADTLVIRLRGDEASVRPRLQAIAKYAQAALARLAGAASVTRQPDAVVGLAEAHSKLQQFNRTNHVFDVERAIATIQQQQAEIGLKMNLINAELRAAEARVQTLSETVPRENSALANTRAALQEALAHYTEAHPRVRELRAAMAKLEAENQPAATNVRPGLVLTANNPSLPVELQVIEQRAAAEAARRQHAALAETQTGLAQQLAALNALRQVRLDLEALAAGAPAPVRAAEPVLLSVIAPPRFASVSVRVGTRLMLGLLFGFGNAALGGTLVGLGLVLAAARRQTIETVNELEQAAQLPTLAQLSNLRDLPRSEQERWALEAFAILKGRIRPDAAAGLICGFISGNRHEGISTCVELLAAAARKQDYVTIVLDLSRQAPKRTVRRKALPLVAVDPPLASLPPGAGTAGISAAAPAETVAAAGQLLANAAASPAAMPAQELVLALEEASPNQVVRLNDPRAVWRWSFRRQLHDAVVRWRQTDNLAVLVDLPPYATAEGVMLAAQVPNLVWCCRRGLADFSETFALMNTLTKTQGHVLGTFFNQARLAPRKRRRRWYQWPLAVLLLLAGSLFAQPDPEPAPATPLASPELPAPAGLSVSEMTPLATWLVTRPLKLWPIACNSACEKQIL